MCKFLLLLQVIFVLGMSTGCKGDKNSDNGIKLTPQLKPTVSTISLSNSTITLASSSVISGQEVQVILTVRDENNQQHETGGLQVEFITNGGTGSGLFSNVVDLQDGTYSTQFKGVKSGAGLNISAKINELPLTSTLPQISITAGAISKVVIETQSDGNGAAVNEKNLINGERLEVFLIARDSNENYVSSVPAQNWSLSSGESAFLSSATGASTTIIPSKGAGLFLLTAIYQNGPTHLFDTTGIILASNTLPMDGLVRWYKVDTLLATLANNAPLSGGWEDLSEEPNSYNANESSANRRPVLVQNALNLKSAVTFCSLGPANGCQDTTADRLRLGTNFNGSSLNDDFTIITLAARGNGSANHILSSSSGSVGPFLGWTNGTTIKFGVNGVSGSSAITATVPSFSTAEYQIITGKLDRGAGSSSPGLRLYVNAIEAARNAGFSSAAVGTTQIPYIGGATSKLFLGEVIIYNRALAEEELLTVHCYLNQRFSLGLNLACQ